MLPLMALMFALTIGLSLFLAAANLFFRDVKYIVEVLLTYAIFFTPVLYDASALGKWKPDRHAQSGGAAARGHGGRDHHGTLPTVAGSFTARRRRSWCSGQLLDLQAARTQVCGEPVRPRPCTEIALRMDHVYKKFKAASVTTLCAI